MPEKTIAVIGSESLIGRELRGVLAETSLKNRVSLIGTDRQSSIYVSTGAGNDSVSLTAIGSADW